MRQCINRAPISGARINHDSTMGGTNMKYTHLATIVAVVLAAFALPSLANAATSKTHTSTTMQAMNCSQSYSSPRTAGPTFGWDHYNVDPYYPNVTDMSAYNRFVHSAKGQAAAARLGISYSGLLNATPCMGWLTAGQHLDAMLSGGFWSSTVKLDKNVTVNFIGPGKQYSGPVRAWYIRVGNKVMVIPFLCGNAGKINSPAPSQAPKGHAAPPTTARSPRQKSSYDCTSIKTVSQAGNEFVLQVVTKTTGNAKFAAATWSPAPLSTINKSTAQFRITQPGVTTIVVVVKFTIGVHSVKSAKCIKLISISSIPTGPAPGPAAACITTNGTPLYAPLPTGISVVNGICTTVTTTTVQTCGEGFHQQGNDNNGNIICISNTNVNTITVPVTVIVTPPTTGCGCTPTLAPTPKPTIVDLTNLQGQGGVLTGNSYQVCATVTGQSGHTLKVLIATGTPGHPGYGSVTATVFNGSKWCATYTAPGELVTDTITAYASYDDVSNSEVTVTATPWQVQAHPRP